MKRVIIAFLFIGLLATFTSLCKSSDAIAKEGSTNLYASCADMCSKNLADFKRQGGKYAEVDRLNLLRDCVKTCRMKAYADVDFKKQHSALVKELDKACVVDCQKCAAKCEELNDPRLKDCIEMCKQCASACEESKTN